MSRSGRTSRRERESPKKTRVGNPKRTPGAEGPLREELPFAFGCEGPWRPREREISIIGSCVVSSPPCLCLLSVWFSSASSNPINSPRHSDGHSSFHTNLSFFIGACQCVWMGIVCPETIQGEGVMVSSILTPGSTLRGRPESSRPGRSQPRLESPTLEPP